VATNDPEISCVIPAYESLELVSVCLASVRAQADVRAEIIVSDDSRGDRVRDLVGHGRGVGGAVRYLEGPRTGNPVDNWNLGLAAARAPLRVVIHQDETLLDPRYLRDAVDALAKPGVAAVIGPTIVSGGSRPSRHNAAAPLGRRLPAAPRFLPLINWIGPTAAFVFRGDHRFDRDLVQLVDVEFYGRVLSTGRYVVLQGGRVGSRGYHDDQITARIEPVVLALNELDRLAARRPPAIGPWTHAAARLATKARRWSR
jgi:glycosyltransferase involved in cell wall biosynthesis